MKLDVNLYPPVDNLKTEALFSDETPGEGGGGNAVMIMNFIKMRTPGVIFTPQYVSSRIISNSFYFSEEDIAKHL